MSIHYWNTAMDTAQEQRKQNKSENYVDFLRKFVSLTKPEQVEIPWFQEVSFIFPDVYYQY